MRKASEFRQHAAECRQLSLGVVGDQRDQLLAMAATWEQLAEERSDFVRRHPESAMPGEYEEEAQGRDE